MIPLIIPNFNQLTWLMQLILWWNYNTKNQPVIILDNCSTYPPLIDFYKNHSFKNVTLVRCKENNCGNNLRKYISDKIVGKYEYYCISNPDILPHPATPEFFLDILRTCIDRYKYHHAGFKLIINDLPGFIDNKNTILNQERKFWDRQVMITHNNINYKAFIAPIDLTFCMFTTKNSGWHYPMDRTEWNNSIRILDAFHLGWYVHPNTAIEEPKFYFKTCLRKATTKHVKGVNNYKPQTL